jgi:flagellar basal-body rod protein FlgG
MRSLFTASTGMAAQQLNIDVIANNIANVTTTGFKRSRAEFSDLLYQEYRRVGTQSSDTGTIVPAGVQVGLGVKPVSVYRINEQGSLIATNNQLDIAIKGRGFLQVTLPDGTVGYSRDGSLKRDQDGQITTNDGYPLEPSITIPANASAITIGKDGTVSVTTAASATSQQIGTIQLADFVNPAGLQPRGDNLYLETAASGAPQTGTAGLNGLGTLDQNALEASNVNVVEEMVNMIETQRAYEMNSKAISTADQMLQFISNKT